MSWLFLVWFFGVIFSVFILYITVRLCSSAWYRSKKEFAIWYKTHIGTEKRGEE